MKCRRFGGAWPASGLIARGHRGRVIYLSDSTAGAKVSQTRGNSKADREGRVPCEIRRLRRLPQRAGKAPFAGGYRMVTPIGAIFSTNITPDPRYGIGGFTLADFDRAMRFGVSRGHTLYPAMPFVSYANTKPEDVEALYAFFMRGVAPAAVPNVKTEIPFPLSMRWPLTVWRWAWAPRPKPFEDQHAIRRSRGAPILSRGWAIAASATRLVAWPFN